MKEEILKLFKDMIEERENSTTIKPITLAIETTLLKLLIMKVSQFEPLVSPMLADKIEKQMLENQYAKVKVLSCKGNPYGEHLPTKILLQLGKETKWFIKTDE